MDFDFSDDQMQLREAVNKWVGKGYDFTRRRGIVRAGGFSREAYTELAELGLCGLYIPEAYGGMGMGPVEAMVAMEELGRGLVLEPLAHALIAGAVINAWAPDAVKTAWLPRIAAGQALVVLAHQERAARYRLDQCATLATETKEGTWHISGSKSVVPAGDLADALVVPAMAHGRQALFLVERSAPGVSTRGYVTQEGSPAACAEAVGVMDATLAITVDYMNQRKQFGVAISSFQALRHRVADVKMQLELARSMSYYASLKLQEPPAERRAAMARAKYQIGQSMRFVGQQAVQLHGGIGVTDEYIVSHCFKKLTQLEITFGDSLHHLGEVSARMQDTAGVFA